MPEDILIKASEMSDFVYCQRGWWLRINGILGENDRMRTGTKAHEDLAKVLSQRPLKLMLAWGAVLLGIIVLLILTLLLLLKML